MNDPASARHVNRAVEDLAINEMACRNYRQVSAGYLGATRHRRPQIAKFDP
jgi:hypothetical protein